MPLVCTCDDELKRYEPWLKSSQAQKATLKPWKSLGNRPFARLVQLLNISYSDYLKSVSVNCFPASQCNRDFFGHSHSECDDWVDTMTTIQGHGGGELPLQVMRRICGFCGFIEVSGSNRKISGRLRASDEVVTRWYQVKWRYLVSLVPVFEAIHTYWPYLDFNFHRNRWQNNKISYSCKIIGGDEGQRWEWFHLRSPSSKDRFILLHYS